MGDLAERLKAEMERQHMTAAELGRRSGIDDVNIRRIINGEVTDPKLSTIGPLARALGRSIDYLLWEVGQGDPEMTKVIDFFTYQWPNLTLEDKRHINGLLGLMLTKCNLNKLVEESMATNGSQT